MVGLLDCGIKINQQFLTFSISIGKVAIKVFDYFLDKFIKDEQDHQIPLVITLIYDFLLE